MKPLSISTAWNETAAFVRREWGILFPIGLALIALPTAFFQLIAPRAAPGQTPEPGPWMWFIIPLALLGALGTLTITILATNRESLVKSAFGLAFRRIVPLIGAVLLLILFLFPMALVAGLMGLAGPIGAAVGILLALGVMVMVWVRMMLMSPVAAVEPLGPMAILKRSWSLTAPYFWKLLGFVLLLIILFIVISLAATAVAGLLIVLLAGSPDPGSFSYFLLSLLGAVVNGVIGVFFAVLIARVYVQLAAAPTSGT
ncbi:MAG TPA: hypothetical protein VNT25_07590 [Allosphingosinicella sp.]|nr:hypothetical protein [Allosphingosinicella sp.]